MDKHFYSCFAARCVRLLCACAVVVCALSAPCLAQTVPGSPVLLSEGTGTTTRAVAFDTVTQSSEPFPVNAPFDWAAVKPGSDRRTRLTLFAMNLGFLSGEGVNALTADASDASGRVYPLKVEFVGKPKYVQLAPAPGNPNLQIPTEIQQEWLYAIVLRLNDEMTDTLGDVVVRVNLHGLASNGVRLAIGQTGGGPPVDSLTEFISAAPPTPPTATPTPTPKAFGPNESNDADVVRLLEQASWGPTTAEVARVKSIGIRAYLNEQFSAPVTNPAKGSNYPDLTFPLDDSNQQCPSVPTQADCPATTTTVPVHRTFFTNAFYGQDQLRPRCLRAAQILVVSRPAKSTVQLDDELLTILDATRSALPHALQDSRSTRNGWIRHASQHEDKSERELPARILSSSRSRERAEPRRDAEARPQGVPYRHTHRRPSRVTAS